MPRRIRLLPVVIFAATLALTLKVGTIWTDSTFSVATATAKSDEPASPPGAPANEKPTAADKAADHEKSAASALPAAKSAGVGDEFDPSSVTQAEFQVLQRLAKRRAELDTLQNDLALKEKLLGATEKRLNGKLAELDKLKKLIEDLLKKHDAEQEKKLRSLVKIYETMKPKNAARILEQLEMDVLLDVMERMREAKSAAIFAAMDPAKAKAVTAKLADRRHLPDPGALSKDG